MNEKKRELIRLATEKYKEIHPCSSKHDLSDCFTLEENRICFWFNTPDSSTHMVMTET